jgi:Acyl-CoA synthetases (AMP-forming)/AMP-acid ligases II
MLQERDYGEVLIAGPGLAAGYLDNPTLTAAKFIELNGKRFYRTGDLANRTKSGELVWAGRADSLLKNRGFLINLETETEPALLAFPSVRLAVAFKWRDKLVGCVQPGTVDVHELREFMQKHYDSFIIPDKIFSMDSFPLNVNSKTDRRALEDLLEKEMAQDDETFLLEDSSLPAYDTLCLAFSQCLHVSSKELNRDSSFTRLGGNSLTAIRLCNLLKKRGFPISVVRILKMDTIGSIEDMLNSLL